MPTTLEYIKLISENNLSYCDISFLYSKCYRIALLTLSKKYSNGNHIFINSESTFENISTDAIAPLFTSITPDGPIGFKKSLTKWDTVISNEAQADYFFHKIVWNRVSQQVTKLLKDTDPFFKKILISLKHFIETNGYNKTTYFGMTYITETNNKLILSAVIPYEEMENLPNEFFRGKYDTVFNNLFRYIETETDYFPAIPLNALVRKLKGIKGNDFISPLTDSTSPFHEENIDIDNIIRICLIQICNNIDGLYLKSSKNEEKIISAYKLVFEDMAEDIKNGGISRGLYDYLHFHVKDLTKEMFYSDYHSQLSYLLGQFKKIIARQINLKGF